MESKLFVIFSGKRKSGKDYLADSIISELNNACITRLTTPIKFAYAKDHGLDFNRLNDSSPYKEQYRFQMVKWGEQKREMDPGYFCSLALESDEVKNANCQIVIVSDARRPTDLHFFIQKFGRDRCLLIRIWASESVRKERNWVFQSGVDDGDTECALDSWTDWDVVCENSNQKQAVNNVHQIVNRINNS